MYSAYAYIYVRHVRMYVYMHLCSLICMHLCMYVYVYMHSFMYAAIYLSFIPGHTESWCPMIFTSLFPMSLCFTIFLLWSCVVEFHSCFFFTTEVSAPFSLDPLFLTLGEL